MAVLSKNTTYAQMLDTIRADAKIYDDPIFSNEYLVKLIDLEISNFYLQQTEKDFYQQRLTYDLSGSANPYSVDLSSTLPFPYQIVDVIYKGSGRTFVKQVSQERLEKELQLTNINANSIFCSIGGDSIDFSFGNDITIVASQSIEILYKRQPNLYTGFMGNINNGLVAYWKCEDATDSSGNGKHFTTNTNVVFNAGKINNAADNAAGGRLERATVLISNTFSLLMWVYIPTVSEKGVFFFNGNGNSNGHFLIGVALDNFDHLGNNLILEIDGNYRSFGAIGTGWRHIVLLCNNGVCSAYKDSAYNANVYTYPFINIGNGGTALLNDWSGYRNVPYTGKADEVILYNRIVTGAEVNYYWNGGNGSSMTTGFETKLDILDQDIPFVKQNIVKKLKARI